MFVDSCLCSYRIYGTVWHMDDTRHRSIRLSDDNWQQLKEIGDLVDRDRSWVIRRLIETAHGFVSAEAAGAKLTLTKEVSEMLDFFGLR